MAQKGPKKAKRPNFFYANNPQTKTKKMSTAKLNSVHWLERYSLSQTFRLGEKINSTWRTRSVPSKVPTEVVETVEFKKLVRDFVDVYILRLTSWRINLKCAFRKIPFYIFMFCAGFFKRFEK